MLVSSTDEFQAFMFRQLHFSPDVKGNYTCYSDREHPEGGDSGRSPKDRRFKRQQ